jgi:hypothetical protein
VVLGVGVDVLRPRWVVLQYRHGAQEVAAGRAADVRQGAARRRAVEEPPITLSTCGLREPAATVAPRFTGAATRRPPRTTCAGMYLMSALGLPAVAAAVAVAVAVAEVRWCRTGASMGRRSGARHPSFPP